MVQRIKIQSGQIVYEATDSAYDIDMNVLGRMNVSKELHIGNDPSADGVITTENNTDLILTPGTDGNIRLQPAGTGGILLNNAVWPTNTPSQGMYLGSTATNSLEFLSFFLSPQVGSDTLTSSQLDILFPSAETNQQVIGPHVTYQKVSSNNWRISSSTYTPVNIAGDTMTGPLILNENPVDPLQAVTKEYVDNIASGLSAHGACETSTTASLPACTYNNESGGIGATLTSSVNSAIGSVGGYSSLSVGSRVLIKDQLNASQNGVYVVTQLGSPSTPWVLTRATDFDGSSVGKVTAGDFVYIQEGTLAGTQWVQITSGTGAENGNSYVIIGIDDIVFTQFTGPGTYIGGPGIDIASNVIANTGVTSLSAGTGIILSGNTGALTISSLGGSVTSVGITGGTGISVTGSPITSNGTISVTNTGVTSLTAGSNISLSGSTGAITISLTSPVPTATNLAGGLTTQIPIQSGPGTTTFDNGLTYNTSTNTLVVGTGTGVLSASSGQSIEIKTDQTLVLKTGDISRLSIGPSGNFVINGSSGSTGQLLSSTGAGSSPVWTSSPSIPGNLNRSVQTGIASTGSGLSTAYALTKDINVISTVVPGTGVLLPDTTGGMQIIVVNSSANDLEVYPNSAGAQIDSLGNGVAFLLPAGARIMYFSVSATQWYTLNTTYS